MFLPPDIGDGFLAAEIQNPVEVHLMYHSLDIGQANLKRGVDRAAAKCPVYHLCVSFGNEALPVKTGDGYIHPPLHPVILPGAVLGVVILHGNDRDILGCHHGIVHHDDAMGLIDIDPVQPHTAGEHQPVVGVEFAELAVADGHVHLDATAHLVVHILPEKRQFALAAHAVGSLEGEIAAHPSSQIQTHSLRAKHIPCLLLADQLAGQRTAAVKDSGEVHVEDHIGQAVNEPVVCGLGKVVSLQNAHDLEEQRVAVLLVKGGKALALFRRRPVKGKVPLSVFLRGVTHHRPGGQFKNTVFVLGHLLTSRFLLFYHRSKAKNAI